MSAVASGLSFEVLRFTVEPVSAEVALLESSRGASARRPAGASASRG